MKIRVLKPVRGFTDNPENARIYSTSHHAKASAKAFARKHKIKFPLVICEIITRRVNKHTLLAEPRTALIPLNA